MKDTWEWTWDCCGSPRTFRVEPLSYAHEIYLSVGEMTVHLDASQVEYLIGALKSALRVGKRMVEERERESRRISKQ